MFGDSEFVSDLAERILKDFDLEEVLDMNDLTAQDVLEYLIENGYISQPEIFFQD